MQLPREFPAILRDFQNLEASLVGTKVGSHYSPPAQIIRF